MKKLLSRIFSAVLAIATVTSVSAAPLTARKVKSAASDSRPVFHQVQKQGTKQLKIHPSTARTRNTAPGSLKNANPVLKQRPSKAPVKVLNAEGTMPEIIGSVIYSDEFDLNNTLCLVPTVEGQPFEVLQTEVNAFGGGVLKGSNYYWTEYTDFFGMIFVTVYGRDYITGEEVLQADAGLDAIFFGEVYDPTTGNIYAMGSNENGNGVQFSTVDYSAGAITINPICEISENINTLVCDAEGQLYAILKQGTYDSEGYFETTGSSLAKVNKATGELTVIGETGEVPEYLSSGAIDHKSGRMFWNVCPLDGSGWLCEVDLTTGTATRIFQFENAEEIMGMMVLPPSADDKAPAAPTNLTLDFPDGSLSGTIKFDIPASLFDGSAATGEVTYNVLANGVSVANGIANVGTQVSAAVEFDAPASYEITVYTTNSVGDSPKTRVTEFIGYGTPATPEPTLAYADGTLTLTWEAVTESSDGGYIDASAVTYTVTDLLTEEVVAEDITATEYSREQAAPTNYTRFTFTVTATCHGISSAAGKSNTLSMGEIVPPYENDFANASDFDEFTVIDANDDGNAWTYFEGEARVMYNSSMSMDDWLISPPVTFEAGKAYLVRIDARCSSASWAERFEVCAGNAANAAAMTTTLIEATDVANTSFETYQGYFFPETSGTYYIGIHGISDRDKFYLYVDNFAIEKGTSTAIPGLPTNLVVTPASYGALFASISFNAPEKTMAGAPLETITKIEIARDGEVIATKTNVAPGASVTIADEVEEGGTYEYSVTAYNEEGKGETATATAFIGVGAPANPSNVTTVVNTDNVVMSWDAPTVDVNGNPLAPAQVKYNVGHVDIYGYVEFDAQITETSWTYSTADIVEQDFIQLVVQAETDGGTSRILGSGLIAVGPAYTDFHETFAGAGLSYVFGTNDSGGGEWNLYTEEQLALPDANGDDGFAAMRGQYADQYASLFTGVISLADLDAPALTYYTYVLVGDNGEPDLNEIEVSVCAPNTYDWKAVKTVVINELGEEGWAKVTVPLFDYAGKDIQIQFKVTVKTYAYTMLDDIKIASMLDYDLNVSDIAAPAKVAAGDDFSINVTIENEGAKEAAAYTVNLYGLTADGYKVIDTKACEALAPQASATVEFTQSVPALAVADDEYIYYAEVVYDLDQNAANNKSDAITVKPIVSNLPAATDLTGEATEAGNVLTWNEPDLTAGVPDPITDDFEDADSFTEQYKDWIFVDVDKSGVGGFEDQAGNTIPLPGIEYNTPHSWFVFNAGLEQFNVSYEAASGEKYLACLFRADGGTVDDWAISPVLKGCAQTISFKAKSYSTSYPDAFEIWYSTGSTDVNDFIKVSDKQVVKTTEWTLYSYDLPAGAKRFAIRACATDAFMLMVDDVTYISGDAVADLTLVGYDIYRNGEKINAEVVAETTYTDTEAAAGEKVTYNVVAIYTTGESAPSNTLELTTTGLDDIFGGINIAAGKGEVIITGAEGMAVQVVAVDGKVLFSGIADTKTTVAVLPGVYVVKAGDKIAKLLVR